MVPVILARWTCWELWLDSPQTQGGGGGGGGGGAGEGSGDGGGPGYASSLLDKLLN